jgi:GMP synthase (glutamine-hydrolysing)
MTESHLTLAESPEAEKAKVDAIAIIDFGSQYSLLIARRVRELKIYCEVLPPDVPWERIAGLNPRGLILSGGPASVYDPGAIMPPSYIYDIGLPVLGICYGMQAIVYQRGGKVSRGEKREYGPSTLHQRSDSPLFGGLPPSFEVWMSHGDQAMGLPPGFEILGSTENCPVAAMGNGRQIWGIQFHPEVSHTPQGKEILQNFLYRICGCKGNWTVESIISQSICQMKQEVGEGNVICATSGGVDSTVTATLVHKAVGEQLKCIFVNNGLLRREEPERELAVFKNLGMDVTYVDATQRFLEQLKGVTDPEFKRKIIGEEFIHVFEEEARRIGKVDFLAQGTLYPDVIESAVGSASRIKSHHNVGGLPQKMGLKLIEPLRFLFKDEVREMGLALGLLPETVWRQPFPGPGLAVRIIGEVTPEKLEMLRMADWIVMNEIKKAKLYREIWQCFAVLTDVRSVGVVGDARTYGYLVALRAVESQDAMTADWVRLPYDLLSRISARIVDEVPGVNRVVYDISPKPPATIEWE